MSRRARGVLGGLALLLACVLVWPAQAADTVVYYHTDALRSVAVVTNAQGQVIERTHYAPYGAVLDRPLRDGPGYGGHEEDAATGLVYMQQRYYCPECGRFLSVDPVAMNPNTGANFNRYWYANDNPYRYTDPDGRCTGSHIAGGGCDSPALHVTYFVRPSSKLRAAPSLASSHTQQQSPQTQCNAECARSHVNRAYEAIKKYKIKGSGYSVEYNNKQYADGLTAPSGVVTLGPSAYKSQSWLGSTLGHEIEVHWDRQFQVLGPWKTVGDYYFREVEAYKYNVLNFKRFGNSLEEQKEIYNRLEYNERGYDYYKDNGN